MAKAETMPCAGRQLRYLTRLYRFRSRTYVLWIRNLQKPREIGGFVSNALKRNSANAMSAGDPFRGYCADPFTRIE